MTTPTVSGPGALSRRTDTGPTQKLADLPDADYGENATYKDLQRGAGLAQAPGGDEAAMAAAAQAAGNVIPFGSPTQAPGTPVTDGADAGAGQGMNALGIQPQSDQDYATIAEDIGVLEWMASQPGASWATRNLLRRVKGGLL